MKKHIKQAVARVEALGLACHVESNGGGHKKLVATKEGVTADVPISCTPKDETACVNMVIQMLRRRFLERGVVI